jgi:GNAT superfamily N-acetyltransferase
MGKIRPCEDRDRGQVLAIINAAAESYRGVIPADRWHEPYVAAEALDREIAAGVRFHGCLVKDELVGVMGYQPMADVDLIRHAYVLPGAQRSGIGGALLEHLRAEAREQLLVGTWAAASWAIRFYERHGFRLVDPRRATALLEAYWDIPPRQVETSVVLASPPLESP